MKTAQLCKQHSSPMTLTGLFEGSLEDMLFMGRIPSWYSTRMKDVCTSFGPALALKTLIISHSMFELIPEHWWIF